MGKNQAVKIADNLYAIDAWMEEGPERLACYLFDTPERVLVEVGPSATLHHLTAALDGLGIDDMAAIVVTHIHIDHAGGAGHLARRYPKARIGVHSRGARHWWLTRSPLGVGGGSVRRRVAHRNLGHDGAHRRGSLDCAGRG